MSVAQSVFASIEPLVLDQGFVLLDVAFVKEGPRWVLRVDLHRPEGGVSLDDCQAVAHALDPVLDTLPELEAHNYVLEVSSPGAMRELNTERELRVFQGRKVKATLRLDGTGSMVRFGALGPATGESVTLVVEGGDAVSIPRAAIKQLRLAMDDEGPAEAGRKKR